MLDPVFFLSLLLQLACLGRLVERRIRRRGSFSPLYACLIPPLTYGIQALWLTVAGAPDRIGPDALALALWSVIPLLLLGLQALLPAVKLRTPAMKHRATAAALISVGVARRRRLPEAGLTGNAAER